MKIHICKSLVLFFIIVSLAFNLSGCGSSGGMDDSEDTGDGTSTTVVEPAAIEMTTGKTEIPADGISSTTITAAMAGSTGEPVSQGTSVTFSTTLGKFPNGQTSYTVKTPDETGSVSTSIIAGTVAGTAQIRGLAGSVSQATTLSFTGEDTQPAATITLTATPDKIASDGLSSSKITATLKDSSGTAVAKGISLIFTTTYGTFLSGGQAATVLTDENGSGSVSLISSTTDAVANVVCSSGGIAQVISVTFSDSITPNLPITSIEMTPTPDAEVTIEPDGYSSTPITVTLSGTGSLYNTQVKLTTTLGKFPNGLQEIVLAATEEGSVATSLISIKGQEGEATLTASAGGVSQSTKVIIGQKGSGVLPSSINVSVGNDKLIFNGLTSTNVVVNVLDSEGEPIGDGETVSLTIEGPGSFDEDENKSFISGETVNGTITDLTYYATRTADSSPGAVTIKATTSNGISASATINLVEGAIILRTNPSGELVANGNSESKITAQLADANGNELQHNGITVTFSTDSGLFSSSEDTLARSTTDESGASSVTYVASTVPGEATITAFATGYGSANVKFTLVSQQIASLKLEINEPVSIPADGVSSTTITATAKDSAGKAVSKGTKIDFKIDNTGLGKFPNGTGAFSVETPDESGTVTVSVISAGKTAGTATITATAGNVTQGVTMDFTTEGADPQPSITLQASPAEVTADGKTTSTITATVNQASGDPAAAGTAVTFSTTIGSFPNGTSYTTDDSGSVTAILLSAPVTATGPATVTCSSLGISRTINVLFKYAYVPGDPDAAKSTVTAEPATLVAGSGTTSTITAFVKDSNGNPVADGTIVIFSAEKGKVNPFTSSTKDGVATTTYTPPNSEGQDTITVKIMKNAGGTVTITKENLITIIGAEIVGITLSANRTSIPISTESSTGEVVLKATPTIQGGGAAPDGTPVKFTIIPSSNYGGFRDGTEIEPVLENVETSNGVARATLVSGATPGTVTVRAESGDAIDEMEITYTPGSMELTVSTNAILGTGKEKDITVTAVIKSAEGNPAAGETVTFELEDVSMGTIIPDSTVTNANGTITAKFKGAAKGGTAVVIAKWIKNGTVLIQEKAEITIHNPPAFLLVNKVDPAAISIKGTGGQSTTQIIFDVKDIQGNSVVDGYRIDFEILSGPDGGEEISPLFAYTSGGQVSTILRSGTKAGPVSIKAFYFHDATVSTTTGQISIGGGQPVGEEFGVSAAYRNISGLRNFGVNYQDEITADAADFYGNAIPDDTSLSFKTYNTGGTFAPPSESTTDGAAKSYLVPTTSPEPMQGFVSVTAEAVNGGRTTHITSLAVISETENKQLLYAGTDGGGVYKSTDSGTSWQNISRSSEIQGQNWIDPYVNDIVVDSDNNNTVYAATGYLGGGNIYRSFDGGTNWNSNNSEEWNGVLKNIIIRRIGKDDLSMPDVAGAALTVVADDDGIDQECYCEDSRGNVDADCICQDEYGIPVECAVRECYRYVWVGTDGSGAFYSDDGKHFSQTQGGGLEAGTYVQDIVKVDGTHRDTAILYAGTATGVYKGEYKTESSDGKKYLKWTAKNRFTGDYITKLALYPKGATSYQSNDVLYTGTENSGVWVSLDGGTSWTSHNSGLGKGLRASTPVVYRYNTGDKSGLLNNRVTLYAGCQTEDWVVKCTAVQTDADNNITSRTFSVTGSVSGVQAQYNTADGAYLIPNVLGFTIDNTGCNFVVNDYFTFSTVRDPGRNIKDLLVDKKNSLLYAITYFSGSLEPHPVGNVYVHDLNIDGSLPLSDWREANTGLPQYEPPDDTTLFAQHTLALDNPDNPRKLFVGGEGINFYKATNTEIASGNPQWQVSKNGLTNRIMARMPVLFSGTVDLKAIPIYREFGTYGDLIYEDEDTGSIIKLKDVMVDKIKLRDLESWIGIYEDEEGNKYYSGPAYIVYVEDENGNPPIQGSQLTITYTDCTNPNTVEYRDIPYADNYIYEGTWRDHSDLTTNDPYIAPPKTTWGCAIVEFSFAPACSSAAPGCSGSGENIAY
ncbi:MAG: invasin domain 3-containing protein [Desulfococcaceae bacterium]